MQDCPGRFKAVREDKILSAGVHLLFLSCLRDCTAYQLRSLGEEHPHQGNLGWVRQRYELELGKEQCETSAVLDITELCRQS